MPEIQGKMDFNPELNTDFEDNLPFQEGVISETYQWPDKAFFQEPQILENLINTSRLVQKFMPKQADIDKILKVIQGKVITVMHLPVTVMEIQAGYLVSPHFEDIYLYLAKNKLSSTKALIQKVETLVEKYILFDLLLLKTVPTPEKETAVLTIPAVCTEKTITLYDPGLFAGHHGVIKTYLTMNDKFFVPNSIHYYDLILKDATFVR